MTKLASLPRRLDVLLLAVLVLARIRVDTLAEAAVLPLRQADVARHPVLGRLLSPAAMELLAQQQLVDPVGLLLIVAALAALLLYMLADEFVQREPRRHKLKLALLMVILAVTVFLPAAKLMLLRQGSGPASYSHDGGVIQTEATIDFLWQGRNPYVEDYTNTPMAEWGINEFRTALYHYPYLPWTFLFSAPFERASQALTGWYDQRLVYLLLFALTLVLVYQLGGDRGRGLLLVMLVGLNPIMGSDLIFGQNDSFVLSWIVLSLWLWQRGQRSGAGRCWQWMSAAVFGLACASKPTAWFLAPFYFLLAARGTEGIRWRDRRAWLLRGVRGMWPAVGVALLIIAPYFIWHPGAMYDDVWGWSSGASATAYQVWGWGASNLLLAFGGLASRFSYWPFWIPELLIGAPLLVLLLIKQARANNVGRALWGYALFLFAFFFVSRFFNENYLGYLLACFALGALITDADTPQS